jgi:hypothetical protein
MLCVVIGNSNYPKAIGALKNPVNDATDFAKELELSNFEVQLLINATYRFRWDRKKWSLYTGTYKINTEARTYHRAGI